MNKVVSALVVAFAGAAAASLLTTWRKSHGSESPGKRRSDGKTMACIPEHSAEISTISLICGLVGGVARGTVVRLTFPERTAMP